MAKKVISSETNSYLMFEEFMNYANDLRSKDGLTFNILVALIVVFISIVGFFLIRWNSRRRTRKDILIMGICDSGKTLIFSRLMGKKEVMTQTSIKENIGQIELKKGSVTVVDIPGHERVRGKFFDEYKNGCSCVLFAIDSVTLPKDIRDVAEYLYSILTEPSFEKEKISFLIICNKQDETMSKNSNVVKNLLEKELNILKVTRTNQPQTLDQGKKTSSLGSPDNEFTFKECPFNVTFFDVSASLEGLGLEKVVDYLNEECT